MSTKIQLKNTVTQEDCRFIECIIRKIKGDESIKVLKTEILPACDEGENYVADIFRVKSYCREESNKGISDWISYLILKKLPLENNTIFNSHRMFENEISAYKYVFPKLEMFCSEQSVRNGFLTPKCYHASHSIKKEMIILQDLMESGFRMEDKRNGLSFQHCSWIMKALAQLHAISFALKDKNPDLLDEIRNHMKEVIFLKENKTGIMGKIWEISFKFGIENLKLSSNQKFPNIILQLETLQFNVLQQMIEMIEPNESLAVICHGDLWNNNILFRYTESGEVEDIRFIDLQAIRYTSCVLDILHIVCTSCHPTVIKQQFEDLLIIYQKSLNENIEKYKVEKLLSLDDIKTEVKNKILYGIIMAFLMFPAVLVDSEVSKNITLEDYIGENCLENWFKWYKRDCQQRSEDLVEAFIELGYLT